MKKPLVLVCHLLPLMLISLAFLAGLPYGYFTLMRCICFVCFTVVLAFHFKTGRQLLAFGYLVFSFLYNPIIPLHLGRTIWSFVNMATILLVVYSFVLYLKPIALKRESKLTFIVKDKATLK